MLSSEKIENLL